MNKDLWVLGTLFGLVLALGLCLGLVWVNTEKVDISYDLKRLKDSIYQASDLNAKLRVEYNHLLAPERLQRLAKEQGLQAVDQRAVRSLRP
jgi:cell division protein FtsL